MNEEKINGEPLIILLVEDNVINQKIVVLTNLQPKKIMDFESQGMLLAADVNNEPFLLKIDENKRERVPPGSRIK